MANKLKKNLFYNIAYQLLNVALPLITVPYVSRVLGVESNGIYSYTYSIVNYFMIFAMLGISNFIIWQNLIIPGKPHAGPSPEWPLCCRKSPWTHNGPDIRSSPSAPAAAISHASVPSLPRKHPHPAGSPEC